jgi:hypothetical protein
VTPRWTESGVTDQAGSLSEIEIETNETLTVCVRSFASSTDQDVLTTTASNAEVVLHRNWERIRSGHDWVTPLGILVPIGLGLLTTDFVPRFGVSADGWKTVFIFGAAASAVWLAQKLIYRWRRGPALTEQQVVALLMEPPLASPSKSARARGAGSLAEAPVPSAEPGAKQRNVSSSRPPLSLDASGQARLRGSETPTVPNGANSGDSAPNVSPGGRVRHPGFGIGTVLDVRPGAVYTHIEVQFDDPDVGTKRLRADLAPLWPVEDEE